MCIFNFYYDLRNKSAVSKVEIAIKNRISGILPSKENGYNKNIIIKLNKNWLQV